MNIICFFFELAYYCINTLILTETVSVCVCMYVRMHVRMYACT